MKLLRWYQEKAVNSIFNAWSNGKNAPLVIVPTGGGKSLVQAAIIKECLALDRDVKILCCAHRVELIEQNYLEACEFMPDRLWQFGIYSASLGIKQPDNQIIFGQIQSVAKKLNAFDRFDVVLIDEAHLMPAEGEGQYRELIKYVKQCNPHAKIGGLTATPFRLKSGYLHTGDGAIFDNVAYNIKLKTLIDEWHLVPVVSPSMATHADLEGVRIIAGEYSQKGLDEAFNIPEVVQSACSEIMLYGQTRRAWLVFCTSKSHGEIVTHYFVQNSVNAEFINESSTSNQRKNAIERFKAGQLKCLVNVGVFTTGFNAPICDLVAMLTATKSASLYIQIGGRGMRTYPDKTDCLFLDFGGNVERHGPIDNVQIKEKVSKSKSIEAPVKVCPSCFEVLHLSVRVCPACEHQFKTEEPNHEGYAYRGDVIESVADSITSEVLSIRKNFHQKEGKPPCAKITYFLQNMDQVVQWLTPEHMGYSRNKTLRLCQSLGLQNINTVRDILDSEIPPLESVTYRKSGQYFNVESLQKKDGTVVLCH